MSLFGGGRRGPRERTEEERRQALIERERRRTGNPAWQPGVGDPLSAAPHVNSPSPAGGGPEPELRPAQPAPAPAPQQPAASAPLDFEDDATGWWEDGAVNGEPAGPVAAWPPPLAPQAAAPRAPEQPAARPAPQPPARPAEPQAPAQARPAQPQARPAQPAQPQARPAQPAQRPAQRGPAPVRIAPEPPAQPVAPAYDLPDHRQIAVHRRRPLSGRATTRTVVSPPGDANMGGTLAPRTSRRRRIAWLVGLLFLLGIGYSQWILWQPTKGSGTTDVIVRIPEGATASEVATRLQDAGVVDSARLFTIRAMLAGKRQDLPSGQLTLKKDMSYGAALADLSGSTVTPLNLVNVTIPEGLSIREMAARFKRQNTVDDYGATAVKILRSRRKELHADYGVPTNTRTLEGLLFPSTYELPAGFTAGDLIDRQLQAFRQNFGSVSMTKAKKANLTPYDVLKIASMVEREAKLTRERPLIAAVIYNRLRAGMPLGIDATFRYASGNWTDPITQSQLQTDGPYNSRLRTGLPPTPIGNPGLASIEAAAAPANVNYLYFVVKPRRCGEHAFSASAAKFQEDSAKYNAARNAAGGSPDTC